MARKPFLWRKLTPAQIDLMERLAICGSLVYQSLEYRDHVAFDELQKLKLAEMRPKGRSKLMIALTHKGRALRDAGYSTNEIIARVTGQQLDLLQHLADAPAGTEIGWPLNSVRGMMLDVCRRMSLRGWVEWYEDRDGMHWARLSAAGLEVLAAVFALDEAIMEMAVARRRGRLQ